MKDHKVIMVDAGTLVANAGNPRTHSDKQIAQIAASIKSFGFINPVIVDVDNRIVAGHGRLLAAKSIDIKRVPTICVDHLSEAQRKAYALADNRIAENAGWDKSLLRIELEKLMSVDLDFSIEATGFEAPEIDLIIHGSHAALDVPTPERPSADAVVSQLGDVWQLGKHYVICGDCRGGSELKRLLNDARIAMVLTDPPYNVKIDGHVSGMGEVQHREFVMAAGEMSSPAFVAFLSESIGSMADVCADGALLYFFMDWRHLGELQDATDSFGLRPINMCVWVKSNGGMGSLYRSQHELVWIVKKGDKPHVNNVELGRHGRYRTNVWNYAGMNAFGAERDAALRRHPTVKPIAMIRDAMLDASHPGDWVLDSFLGSGTTLLAAE